MFLLGPNQKQTGKPGFARNAARVCLAETTTNAFFYRQAFFPGPVLVSRYKPIFGFTHGQSGMRLGMKVTSTLSGMAPVLPNPSFNLSANSRPLGPASALAYPAPAGPSSLLPSPG